MAITQRSSSGESRATCCTMPPPNERPTRATGGSQTASINSAVSRAKASKGQGSGTSQRVVPMPRLSNVVLRNASLKYGIW